MIEKLIKSFSKGFAMTQSIVDDDTGWYLESTCSLNGKVIYVNTLDLLPLYDSMKKRMNDE